MYNSNYDVSIILPVHNAALWLEECLDSVVRQDFPGKMELSIFNDASTDSSKTIIERFTPTLKSRGIKLTLSSGEGEPKGVGFAKNRAISQSSGNYLCFLDADDCMMESRVRKQFEACGSRADLIVGTRFHRQPPDSTPRYVDWANHLDESQLYTQAYTSFGPTLIMPTWFCHRHLHSEVGGFVEGGKGTPEDLIFFYEHLRRGGSLARVEEDLLMYRYHPHAATFSVTEEALWSLRIKELERQFLPKWSTFTIWNAGKQGRKFYRHLCKENKQKVIAFCDVDAKKLCKGVYTYEESEVIPRPQIPILHFRDAKPPFVICVKLNMTGGNFEENLKSLKLQEGEDYIHFN